MSLRRSIAAGLVLGCLTLGTAQPAAGVQVSSTAPAAERAAGPKIVVTEPVFSFGRQEFGQVIEHTFIVTNTGDQPLEIRDVRPSCGCTLVGSWDREVGPHKFGGIPVVYRPGPFDRDVHKTIILVCNDVTQTNVTLHIQGTIWKPIEVTPAIASFTLGSDSDAPETRRLRIVNNLEGPLTLSEPACTNQAFRGTLETLRPGREFELQIAFDPSYLTRSQRQADPTYKKTAEAETTLGVASPVSLTSLISLKTSSLKVPVLAVTAHALILPALAATPTRITLPAGPLRPGTQEKVTIQNNGTNSLLLSDLSVNAPGVDAEVQEVQPGRAFVLVLNFPPGFQIRAGQNVEVRVKTNHPQFPTLKIPVVQGRSLVSTLKDETGPEPPTGEPNTHAPLARR